MITRKILSLFLPEKYNGSYILPTKIVGIAFEKEAICATVITFSQKEKSIKEVIKQGFEKEKNSKDFLTIALQQLKEKLGSYDKLTVSLPSKFVLFKELTLPFLDKEKIKMTLPFELEPVIPFSLEKVSYDFIITKQDIENKKTTVIVSIVEQKVLDSFLAPFFKANLKVWQITVDALATFSLYSQSSHLTTQKNNAVLLVEQETLTLLYFTKGQLKHIRTFTGSSSQELELILQEKIEFTLKTFLNADIKKDTLEKIVCITNEENSLLNVMQNTLSFKTEFFSVQTFLKTISIKNTTKNTPYFGSLSAALASYNQSFNLALKLDNDPQEEKVNYQIIAGLLLCFATFFIITTNTIIQIKKLSKEVQLSEEQIIKTIKKSFPNITIKNKRDAFNLAQKEVKKEAAIWSAFSTKNRSLFLYYLSEMSEKIDRETLGLNLKKMILNKENITIEGNVRNFDAVEKFEQQLRSTKLFLSVPDMQKVEFSLKLSLASSGEV